MKLRCSGTIAAHFKMKNQKRLLLGLLYIVSSTFIIVLPWKLASMAILTKIKLTMNLQNTPMNKWA